MNRRKETQQGSTTLLVSDPDAVLDAVIANTKLPTPVAPKKVTPKKRKPRPKFPDWYKDLCAQVKAQQGMIAKDIQAWILGYVMKSGLKQGEAMLATCRFILDMKQASTLWVQANGRVMHKDHKQIDVLDRAMQRAFARHGRYVSFRIARTYTHGLQLDGKLVSFSDEEIEASFQRVSKAQTTRLGC